MPERFRLRPVPAGPHVAPAAARSPAPIEKQPRAAAALAKLPDVATAQKSVELQREGVLAKKVTRMRLDLPHRFDHAGRTVRWGRMGSGPAIVLVHGTPFSSQVWRRIAPCLASRRTVYWFDLLG